VTCRATLPVLGALFLTGCVGFQHSLDPRGPNAEKISTLSWVMIGGSSFIVLFVTVLLLWGLWRGQHPRDGEDPTLSRRQSIMLVLMAGAIVPVVILTSLIIYSVSVDRAVTTEPENPLIVDIIGHQWWWEVRYPDYENPHLTATTANEIHIPAGRPVRFQLAARDVIHSFWVPNLHGKKDLIPGRSTAFWMQADEPGIYRGQCAEFCGLQHAKMALYVVAEPPEQFEQWLALQRQPAAEPADEQRARGREVFLSAPCMMCHAVRGTTALASVAPDLTHIGGRMSLASGSLPNTRGNMAAWILAPQTIKPGNHMPPVSLPPEDLRAMLDYLQSLK
jgi:cytochrome c oxidase subunit II